VLHNPIKPRFECVESAPPFGDGSILLLLTYAPHRQVLGDGLNARAAYRDACRQARQFCKYGAIISEDYFIWRRQQDRLNATA